jgi:hypothetical protein
MASLELELALRAGVGSSVCIGPSEVGHLNPPQLEMCSRFGDRGDSSQTVLRHLVLGPSCQILSSLLSVEFLVGVRNLSLQGC